jgi:hypothetical protein
VEWCGWGRRRPDLEVPTLGWSEFGQASATEVDRLGRRLQLSFWGLASLAHHPCGRKLGELSWWLSNPPPPWCMHSFCWLAGRSSSTSVERRRESLVVVVAAPGGVLVVLDRRWRRFFGEGRRVPLVRLRHWKPPWWGVLIDIVGRQRIPPWS